MNTRKVVFETNYHDCTLTALNNLSRNPKIALMQAASNPDIYKLVHKKNGFMIVLSNKTNKEPNSKQ